MMKGIVLAIAGPAGSGKSSVAKILSKRIDKCVNIQVDQLKHFIVNGFVYGRSPEGVKQWEILGDNIGFVAQNFHKSEYNVIINGFLYEPAWETLQKHLRLTHKILLFPEFNETVKRDSKRTRESRLGKESIKEHYDYFSTSSFYDDFTKVDSTGQRVKETADQILNIIGKN